jgi:hypothetical protein
MGREGGEGRRVGLHKLLTDGGLFWGGHDEEGEGGCPIYIYIYILEEEERREGGREGMYGCMARVATTITRKML